MSAHCILHVRQKIINIDHQKWMRWIVFSYWEGRHESQDPRDVAAPNLKDIKTIGGKCQKIATHAWHTISAPVAKNCNLAWRQINPESTESGYVPRFLCWYCMMWGASQYYFEIYGYRSSLWGMECMGKSYCWHGNQASGFRYLLEERIYLTDRDGLLRWQMIAGGRVRWHRKPTRCWTHTLQPRTLDLEDIQVITMAY